MRASYDGPHEYRTLTPLGRRRGSLCRFYLPPSNPGQASASDSPHSAWPRGQFTSDTATVGALPCSTMGPSAAPTVAFAAAAAGGDNVSANDSFSARGRNSNDTYAANVASVRSLDDDNDRPLCRYHFLAEGSCVYGDACRFSHTLPPGVSTAAEARKCIPCQYHLVGCCKYGEACLFGHGDAKVVVPDSSIVAEQRCDSEKIGGEMEECCDADDAKCGNGDNGGVDSDEEDRTCAICFEDVASTETGRFGLLSCCDHRFCLSCLRQWRRTKVESSSDVVRSCPTCRKRSDYIVPHVRFVSGAEKERVVSDYRARLAVKPCKSFDGTMGSCLFGRECFYAHIRGGVDVKNQDRDPAEMARERAMRNRRRTGRQHSISSWFADDFSGSANSDDIEAIASFLALLSFYGYGFAEDSDEDDDSIIV